jgi:hypothetical protein
MPDRPRIVFQCDWQFGCGAIWGDAFGSEKRLWAQIRTCLNEGRLGRIGFGRLRPHDESCGGISAARRAGWTIMMGIM